MQFAENADQILLHHLSIDRKIKLFKRKLTERMLRKTKLYNQLKINPSRIHPVVASIALINDYPVHDELIQWIIMHFGRERIEESGIENADNDDCPERWFLHSLQRQNEQSLRESGTCFGIQYGNENSTIAGERLQIGLGVLKRCWPESYAQISELVTHVAWHNAPNHMSSTDPASFGAVYINPHASWPVAQLIETILHESGHLCLMVQQTFDSLITNPNFITDSPLRKDPRPLKGVLHAVYVLSRMIKGYQKVLEANELPTEHAFIKRQLELNSIAFHRGLQTLNEHAELTEEGIGFLELMHFFQSTLESRKV